MLPQRLSLRRGRARAFTLAIFLVLVACAHSAPRSFRSRGATWDGGCSPMHGGVPGVHSVPVVIRRAKRLDRALASSDRGVLVVEVYAARDTLPLASVAVSERRLLIGAYTAATGTARLTAPAGLHVLTIRRIGYESRTDSVEVRAGYADTLWVGLGSPPMCFT